MEIMQEESRNNHSTIDTRLYGKKSGKKWQLSKWDTGILTTLARISRQRLFKNSSEEYGALGQHRRFKFVCDR